MSFHADLTLYLIHTRILLCFFNAHGSHGSHGSCSRRGAHCYWNTRLLWTRIIRMTRIMFARGGAERNVDFWMLNVELLRLAAMWNCSMMNIDAHMVAIERKRYEWDKYGFNTGGVNPHCLCSVLKLESLYSFSPTIGKKAFIVYSLIEKSSKSSLLYIIQCLKLSSEVTSF